MYSSSGSTRQVLLSRPVFELYGLGSLFGLQCNWKSTPATPRFPEARRRDLSDLRVLVVDDNATYRRILRH
jgi:hypothetical protein